VIDYIKKPGFLREEWRSFEMVEEAVVEHRLTLLL
jgi:hypothetical protein